MDGSGGGGSICRLKGGGALMRFSAGMNIFMKAEPALIYLAAESCTKNKRPKKILLCLLHSVCGGI